MPKVSFRMASASGESVLGVQTNTARKIHWSDHTGDGDDWRAIWTNPRRISHRVTSLGWRGPVARGPVGGRDEDRQRDRYEEGCGRRSDGSLSARRHTGGGRSTAGGATY